ncbi:MAG: hypothetical protein U0132_08845 [Gemmatimonadaceae bacterium]
MSRMLLASLCAAVLTLSTGTARAQLDELHPGARVRLRAPTQIAGRTTGTVLTRSADSISFGVENGGPITVAIANITALDVSRGKNRLRGLAKGALWGFGVGLVLGAVSYEEGSCDGYICDRGQSAAFAAMGGAMVGAPIGAVIGSEKWQSVKLPVASVGGVTVSFGLLAPRRAPTIR